MLKAAFPARTKRSGKCVKPALQAVATCFGFCRSFLSALLYTSNSLLALLMCTKPLSFEPWNSLKQLGEPQYALWQCYASK
jgi:hypothetical protein